MNPLAFVLKTKNHQHPLLDEPTLIATDHSVTIRKETVRHSQGMAVNELLIGLAIGVASGVPAGIAANWIFTKLGLGKDAQLYDQTGQILTTVKQLEAQIEALTRELKK